MFYLTRGSAAEPSKASAPASHEVARHPSVSAVRVPAVALKNTAAPGLTMPFVGLGTGGYNGDPRVGYGGYPECWSDDCGNYTTQAVFSWLAEAGGRRIDASNSYQNQRAVGQGMRLSGVPRSEIFLLQKVGPDRALGHDDTLEQFEEMKREMQVDYVDALLVHWPLPAPSAGNVAHKEYPSSDPYCKPKTPTYDAKQCRLSTWKAMVRIFETGGAKAIGVSNYKVEHLQEIIDAGLPLPSINQCPFHIYRSAAQQRLVDVCRENDILFMGYSPLGVPDWWRFPEPMASNQLIDPEVKKIAAAHGKSPAQVLLNWQWQLGVPFHPRTQRLEHMRENLRVFDFKLGHDEVVTLSSRPQDFCKIDPRMYQCVGTKDHPNRVEGLEYL
eukprot:TRINITY_DN8613_c0_g1_i2.p1 TRINITY_DN8613_c0_g1~~TRINITY_DN8613_c0_g1_i2.p1  ORF type:complete len:435 (+),score=76.01 TRINITY_DN8613_c0_g1_i2:152-1306(+)